MRGRAFDSSRPPAPDEFHPDNRLRAWVCLALTLITLPLGVVVGGLALEVLAPGATADPLAAPLGARAVAGGAALAVILAAPLCAVLYGRRAIRVGDPRGRLPALIGALGSILFLLLNIASVLVG
jgi:hypothetical protein